MSFADVLCFMVTICMSCILVSDVQSVMFGDLHWVALLFVCTGTVHRHCTSAGMPIWHALIWIFASSGAGQAEQAAHQVWLPVQVSPLLQRPLL